MSLTRTELRTTAKELAQDKGADTATGVKLLLTDPDDYNEAIKQALRQFERDQPNIRVVDYTVVTAGFRFPLFGPGNIVPNNPGQPAAPVPDLVPQAGIVTVGAHTWKVAVAIVEGISLPSVKSTVVTTSAGNQQVDIQLPTLPMNGTGWYVYRTIAGDSGSHKQVGFQSGVGGTSGIFRDNIADGSLGATAPTESTAFSPNAWLDGYSDLRAVWWPYLAAQQDTDPLDENGYRTALAPNNVTNLEFLSDRPATGDVIRVAFTAPHTLDETDASKSSVRQALVEAVKVLTASVILQLAANKAAQNTGNTGLPNDVVDRRTQSDIYRSRSKELRETYHVLVGKGGTSELHGASAIRDMDVEPLYPFGYFWHPSGSR